MSKSEPGLRVPLEDWRDSAQHSGADAERPGSVSLLESHPVQVLWSSLDAPWIDVLKVEKVRIRKGDVPEFCVSEHSIGLRLSPPGMVDMRYAGEPPHHSLAHPGDFCLSPQGALLSARQYRRADFLAVALAPTFVSAVAEQAAEGQSVELTNPCSVRDAVVHHLVLALAAEAEAGCPAGRLYGEGLATALTVHLLRRYAVVPHRIVEYREGLPPARLRRVLDYIASHLHEELSLRRLAALACLSPHHFASFFKQSTGVPPHQYVLRQRIVRARQMLTDDQQALADIAYALGFANQAHFTTAFRKFTGTTPALYRADTKRRGSTWQDAGGIREWRLTKSERQ